VDARSDFPDTLLGRLYWELHHVRGSGIGLGPGAVAAMQQVLVELRADLVTADKVNCFPFSTSLAFNIVCDSFLLFLWGYLLDASPLTDPPLFAVSWHIRAFDRQPDS
jgi:hypothetical protein